MAYLSRMQSSATAREAPQFAAVKACDDRHRNIRNLACSTNMQLLQADVLKHAGCYSHVPGPTSKGQCFAAGGQLQGGGHACVTKMASSTRTSAHTSGASCVLARPASMSLRLAHLRPLMSQTHNPSYFGCLKQDAADNFTRHS